MAKWEGFSEEDIKRVTASNGLTEGIVTITVYIKIGITSGRGRRHLITFVLISRCV